MTTLIQSEYQRHPDGLRVGMASRALQLGVYESHTLEIPSTGGVAVRPGDAVYYDDTDDTIKLLDASNRKSVLGIVAMPTSAIGGSDGTFEYAVPGTGTASYYGVRVMLTGYIAVRAGASLTYNDRIEFNTGAQSDHEYIEMAALSGGNEHNVDEYPRCVIRVASRGTTADGAVFEAQILPRWY